MLFVSCFLVTVSYYLILSIVFVYIVTNYNTRNTRNNRLEIIRSPLIVFNANNNNSNSNNVMNNNVMKNVGNNNVKRTLNIEDHTQIVGQAGYTLDSFIILFLIVVEM